MWKDVEAMQTTLILDSIRNQTRIMIRISVRDLPRRLCAAGVVLSICWIAGERASVVAIAAFILGFEVAARIAKRHLPASDDDIGPGLVAAVWAMNVGSTIVHLVPSLLLAAQPSVALLLVGFIWLFGVYVHISNTYVALPFFNWSLMIPAASFAVMLLLLARNAPVTASPTAHWVFAAMAMLIYATNTLETLNKQKDTQKALNLARAEQGQRLREMEHIARHDGLTGLLNRQAFDADLARMLETRSAGTELGLFLIDLDGFKPINDTYSHAAGDRVLVTIAARLKQTAGNDGLAARLGGDEFAVVLPALHSECAALMLADDMTRAIAQPVEYGEKLLRIGGSIGIGLSGRGNDTVAGLCAGADQAMYRAKGDMTTRFHLFDPALYAPRPSLEDRKVLVTALQQGQIRPHYQAKVMLGTGAICGFEALARWQHPTRGLLLPAQFLPAVNELGLQGDFLTAMAQHVFSDVSRMVADGLAPGQVSINVPEVTMATHSGRQDLNRLIAAHPGASGHITFEITEDVFVARAGDMIKDSIAHFRRAGVRISLDDFGTGFASFQHLRQLEFDEMKIDSSFIAGLGQDPAAEVLIRGFLSIASGLGVMVIAEGVETSLRLSHLRRMGCTFGQGWHFGKAMPVEEVRIRLFAEAGPGASDATAGLMRSG